MTYPDPVALVIAWLDPLVAPEVVVDVPRPRPAEFIQVRRIGGPANPPVTDRPTLDFRSWAPSALEAMATLMDVRTLVWRLSGTNDLGVVCYDVAEVMGPRNANDPETSEPLAIFTASLSTRADDAIQFTN